MGDLIVWSVVEEHFDEAAYLFGQWTRAFESPTLTFEQLARSLEQRFFAHWDGLVVGGAPVAETLLVPLLAGEQDADFARIVVAALTLIDSKRGELCVRALASENGTVVSAAQQALVLNAPAAFDDWLRTRMESSPDADQKRALLPIASKRGLGLSTWGTHLRSDEASEVAAAASGLRSSDPGRHRAALEQLLAHPERSVRDAALVTALCGGSIVAWRRCIELALRTDEPEPMPMLLLALLGGVDLHTSLLGQLDRPSHRRAALSALAFSGSAVVAEAVLPHLEATEALEAKLAGQAISVITGLDLTLDAFVGQEPPPPSGLPPLEDDDLDASLIPPPEDALPMPNAPAVRAWCTAQLPSLHRSQRWLQGKPWTAETARAFLLVAPLSQRHPVALWLTLASRGAVRVDTRAFTVVQREQIAAASNFSDLSPLKLFGGW